MNLVEQLSSVYSKTTRNNYKIVGDISKLANQIINMLDSNVDMLVGLVHLRTKHANYALVRIIQNTIFSVLVAKRSNWEAERMHILTCACLTENISLFQLQNELAEMKQEKLTEEQVKQIRSHPTQSAKMLAALGVTDKKWLSAVALHHEKLDGRGYPHGFMHGRIPDEARLMSIADRYGSMITPRANREAGNPSQIMRYFLSSKRGEFDKKLSHTLITELGVYPSGSTVVLHSGEVALVTYQGKDHFHPQVSAICSPTDELYIQPIPRDTNDDEYTISRLVDFPEVKQFNANLFWGDAANKIQDELLSSVEDIPIETDIEIENAAKDIWY